MYKNIREFFSLTVIVALLVLGSSYLAYYSAHSEQVQQEKKYINSVVSYMDTYCQHNPLFCQNIEWQQQLFSSVFYDEKIARVSQYDKKGELLWKSTEQEPHKTIEILEIPYDKYNLTIEYYSIDKNDNIMYIASMCLAAIFLIILLFEWYHCIFYAGEFLNFWLCSSLSKKWKEKDFSCILILPPRFLNNVSKRAVDLIRQVNLQWFLLGRKHSILDTLEVKKNNTSYIHLSRDKLITNNQFIADPFSSTSFWTPYIEGRWLMFLLTSMTLIQSFFLFYAQHHNYLLWTVVVNLVGATVSFIFSFFFNKALLLLFVNLLIGTSLLGVFYQYFNFSCLIAWIACFSLFYSLRIVHKDYIYPEYDSTKNILAGVLAALPFSTAVLLFFSGSHMIRDLFSFLSILASLFLIYSIYFVVRHHGWLHKQRDAVVISLQGMLKNSVNLHLFFLSSLAYDLLEIGQYTELSLSIVYIGMLFYIIYQSGAMIFQSRIFGILSLIVIIFSYIFSFYAFLFSYIIFFIGYGLVQEMNHKGPVRLFFIDSLSISLGFFFAFLCGQMAEKKYFFVSICFLWVVYHFYRLKNNCEKPL